MLLGEYEHTVDDKNRLTLPARFRRAFADGIVLTRGMEGCVFAYPRDRWEEVVNGRIGGLDVLSACSASSSRERAPRSSTGRGASCCRPP